jgi:hypothetical protein
MYGEACAQHCDSVAIYHEKFAYSYDSVAMYGEECAQHCNSVAE